MTVLYVATNLEYYEFKNSENLANDLIIDNRIYRKLTPEYLIWLSSRFNIAFKKADAGKLTLEALSQIADRLTIIEEKAKDLFNKNEIIQAKRKLRTCKYNPPTNNIKEHYRRELCKSQKKSLIISLTT